MVVIGWATFVASMQEMMLDLVHILVVILVGARHNAIQPLRMGQVPFNGFSHALFEGIGR